ncbi:DUF342 domain-containing protein [Oceanobacillus halophilus]|uniref:DUF342 domain-containing protein n=1 Tax=Oceanobacillus halophilus TaxID=930130 RepID=A0A495ABX7_9BACI|nr:FapA family protein [Oceanobacillus halophilus]RKQ37507.1 DUF342 domain-containing protein [Oceanobacillus halophilus]
MEQLETFFYIVIAKDKMSAQIHCTDTYTFSSIRNEDWNLDLFTILLEKNKVIYGINFDKIKLIINKKIKKEDFPITIANGQPAIHGKDGTINYELNTSSKLERTNNRNFRDVMRIPNVQVGQKIITISNPTKGTPGINIHGNILQPKPGKTVTIHPGENVEFAKDKMAFFATANGQLCIKGNFIHIYPVFEVNETLSMKEGNLDFTGNIVIHGDVPTGYVVKAEGDISVFGMVEGAKIISLGSVYISKGLAGQRTGYIKANENITIGYINQGYVHAGKDLIVEGSILHSECVANNHVLVKKGSIIGGKISAGASMEVNNVGNPLNIKTEISFGFDKSKLENKKLLLTKKQELIETLKKLTLLEEKLKEQKPAENHKVRITLLRIKNSFQNTQVQLDKVNTIINTLNSQMGDMNQSKLIVRDKIYQNVFVTFGKYKRFINEDNYYVQLRLIKNEITMEPIME